MDSFAKAYQLWTDKPFPSGGHVAPTAYLKADLAYADAKMMDTVIPWVEDGQLPGSDAEIVELLRDLEELRDRAVDVRNHAEGDSVIVAEDLLRHSELMLEVYRGFLEKTGFRAT
jgi:hypothetical protein